MLDDEGSVQSMEAEKLLLTRMVRWNPAQAPGRPRIYHHSILPIARPSQRSQKTTLSVAEYLWFSCRTLAGNTRTWEGEGNPQTSCGSKFKLGIIRCCLFCPTGTVPCASLMGSGHGIDQNLIMIYYCLIDITVTKENLPQILYSQTSMSSKFVPWDKTVTTGWQRRAPSHTNFGRRRYTSVP
jgi:hypothetical protein